MQHALVSFTGISVVDQIVMYQGARLDPAKTLGAYRLPVVGASQSRIVSAPSLRCRQAPSLPIAVVPS